MRFGDDGRAQSTLVGAILLFAILIAAFSTYQAAVVPDQNAEVEFNHNAEIQSDMQGLRNSLLDVRSVEEIDGEYTVVSEHRPVRLRLGTQYPARLLALNPPAPAGTIETEEGTFEIRNAQVSSAQFEEHQGELIRSHDTKLLAYRPGYNEYRNAPTTRLEHSFLYNDFEDGDVSRSDQRLIRGPDGRTIDVVLLAGDVSLSSSDSVTLDPETVDGPTTHVPITQDGGPIEIEFSTSDPAVWSETLSGLDSVAGVAENEGEGSVTVELESGEYELRMTTVRIDGEGGDGPFTEIQKPRSEVVGGGSVFDTEWVEADGTAVDDDTVVSVAPGGAVTLTAEVRGNESGNPIEGRKLNAGDLDVAGDTAAFETFSFPGDQTTDAGGRVDVTVETADAATDGDRFEAYVTAGDDSDVLEFEVDSAGATEIYPTGYTRTAGTFSGFSNMQTDDGSVAVMDGSGPNAFDIDVRTDNVPAGSYDLELGVSTVDLQGGSGGITVTVEDEDGNPLGTTTLDGGDSGTTVVIPVSTSSQQDLTVAYRADRQNDRLDIDFQRFAES